MYLLAQSAHVSLTRPGIDPEVMVVAIVFSSLLILGITYVISRMVVAIKVASIHAELTEKLVQEGMSSEQIVRIIESNQKQIALPKAPFGRGWKKADPAFSETQGKPQPL